MRPPLAVAGYTDEVLDVVGGTLTEAERTRAERFTRKQDRLDFVAAHLLVRHCAAEILGTRACMLTVVQRCDRCGQAHGRPWLAEEPELSISLAHTSGYVCAAAGPGRIGVDAEHATGGPADENLAALALTPAESALVGRDNRKLIRQWVRKEALVKRGELALDRLRDVDLSGLPVDDLPSGSLEWEGRHLLEWTAGTVIATAITDEPAKLRLLGG
ncbi:phosphopantetheinyl transferase-like protein [Planotetraspora sp. A-T 1434]|uniref:4'-phosphopantetheinyl transferase family protein n=1 Tax=Planotetraspora sp. A-T 1434 TaxID=2979219 RepID=UPI0021BFD825|nr:phosphopantetheinyl transferase-like protein [Planotetraspora sp. A-T 1434]MCT9930496.1 phosphopantetheinyl transferase-like protein [Planotetraspora sp. A-T 1434]